MKISYARVSVREQNVDRQMDALKAAGCEEIFTGKDISGVQVERDKNLVHQKGDFDA